jgi:hypothetical protein
MKLLLAALATIAFSAASTTAPAQISDSQKAAVKWSFVQNTAAEFVAQVDFNGQRYRFATFVDNFESPTEGIEKQRLLSGWKGEYLFVRHQCGQKHNWRCVVDQVFSVHDGKLHHLGSVESRSCDTLGCRYSPETGVFQDIYDIYQVNPITGGTDTPPLPIARKVVAHQFVTDLDETWRINQAAYVQSVACLNQTTKQGFATPCEQNQAPWSAFVFAAKLTHYTGRNAEKSALHATYPTDYCAKSANKHCLAQMNAVQDYFQRFDRGAKPVYEPSLVSLVAAGDDRDNRKPQELPKRKTIQLKL